MIEETISRERLIELERIERRIRALFAYYTDSDLAVHFGLALTSDDIVSEGTTVQKVWINRKLVQAFRDLRGELGL